MRSPLLSLIPVSLHGAKTDCECDVGGGLVCAMVMLVLYGLSLIQVNQPSLLISHVQCVDGEL